MYIYSCIYTYMYIYKQADDEGDSSSCMVPPQIESLKSQLATNFTLTEHIQS